MQKPGTNPFVHHVRLFFARWISFDSNLEQGSRQYNIIGPPVWFTPFSCASYGEVDPFISDSGAQPIDGVRSYSHLCISSGLNKLVIAIATHSHDFVINKGTHWVMSLEFLALRSRTHRSPTKNCNKPTHKPIKEHSGIHEKSFSVPGVDG